MKLKYKIFITLILTSCTILALTGVVMQISIKKDFIKFLNDVEFGRQSRLIEALKRNYKRNGGWDNFYKNPRSWHRLMVQSRPNDAHGGSSPHVPVLPPKGRKGRPSPPPRDPVSLDRRLCLLDVDKTYVAGGCQNKSQFEYQPIVLSGETIGWLGLEKRDDLRKPLELKFLEKQTRSFFIIGLGILVMALLVSYGASKHLLSPIQAIAKGTRAMRGFNFDARIDVTSTDELGALAADFNLMAQTLKQYETMRKNWVSDISHELRTPVAVIQSKLEALQDGVREPTPELLESLHKDILGLGKLINDLHRISLMDSGTLTAKLEPVSLVSLCNQILDTFSIRFEKQSIDIRTEWNTCDSGLPDINGDKVLLKRVFGNLLENSLKYTDSPGILNLACTIKKDNLLVEIEDSRPGVPPECLETIFERLYRLEGSRSRSSGGSGLGLSMSREIISLHRGTIKATPSSLGGLKIEIELPLIKKGKTN